MLDISNRSTVCSLCDSLNKWYFYVKQTHICVIRWSAFCHALDYTFIHFAKNTVRGDTNINASSLCSPLRWEFLQNCYCYKLDMKTKTKTKCIAYGIEPAIFGKTKHKYRWNHVLAHTMKFIVSRVFRPRTQAIFCFLNSIKCSLGEKVYTLDRCTEFEHQHTKKIFKQFHKKLQTSF